MPADFVHLVRHGEVDNPEGVLYGRLSGFGLSARGAEMARLAARALHEEGVPVAALYASPLQRTRESAEPWAELFGHAPVLDERLIEADNKFQGDKGAFSSRLILRPSTWRHLVNPFRPSWGEAYRQIEARMLAVMRAAVAAVPSGHVVLVSHQLPIWTVHRSTAGKRLFHDPRRRRCSLSSITSFAPDADGTFRETGYREPAAGLLAAAHDEGAV